VLLSLVVATKFVGKNHWEAHFFSGRKVPLKKGRARQKGPPYKNKARPFFSSKNNQKQKGHFFVGSVDLSFLSEPHIFVGKEISAF
jgi:hypothetical protein